MDIEINIDKILVLNTAQKAIISHSSKSSLKF